MYIYIFFKGVCNFLKVSLASTPHFHGLVPPPQRTRGFQRNSAWNLLLRITQHAHFRFHLHICLFGSALLDICSGASHLSR